MKSPTIEVVTPMTQAKVLVREWITGRQSEYIQEPYLSAVKMTGVPGLGGATKIDSSIDATGAIQESDYREIKSYIEQVGDETDTDKILESILDMPESDYQFIKTEITNRKEASKKKLEVSNT